MADEQFHQANNKLDITKTKTKTKGKKETKKQLTKHKNTVTRKESKQIVVKGRRRKNRLD